MGVGETFLNVPSWTSADFKELNTVIVKTFTQYCLSGSNEKETVEMTMSEAISPGITKAAAAAAIWKINSLGNQVASADNRLISKQLVYLCGLVGLLVISAGDTSSKG